MTHKQTMLAVIMITNGGWQQIIDVGKQLNNNKIFAIMPLLCYTELIIPSATVKRQTATGPKFTDDLRTILRQFSDLRQS